MAPFYAHDQQSAPIPVRQIQMLHLDIMNQEFQIFPETFMANVSGSLVMNPSFRIRGSWRQRGPSWSDFTLGSFAGLRKIAFPPWIMVHETKTHRVVAPLAKKYCASKQRYVIDGGSLAQKVKGMFIWRTISFGWEFWLEQFNED